MQTELDVTDVIFITRWTEWKNKEYILKKTRSIKCPKKYSEVLNVKAILVTTDRERR
jgi:hypothetical protein